MPCDIAFIAHARVFLQVGGQLLFLGADAVGILRGRSGPQGRNLRFHLKDQLVNVVNILIESKDEIISNLEKVLDKICNKKELLEEKEKLENSLTEQVEKIQDLIDINSRVAQNQEKYKKEYDALIKNYDETKCKFEQLEIKLSQQAAKHQMIKDYINTLKKQEKLLTKFDGLVWGSLLESATIKDKDVIVFRFKDGTEING